MRDLLFLLLRDEGLTSDPIRDEELESVFPEKLKQLKYKEPGFRRRLIFAVATGSAYSKFARNEIIEVSDLLTFSMAPL